MKTNLRSLGHGLHERLGHYKKEIAGVAVLTIAATGMGIAIKMNADAGRERRESEQAALELVIRPDMQRIAGSALQLAREHPGKFDIKQIGQGMVEIKGEKQGQYNNEIGIDVVMRADASGEPNPSDPLFVGVKSSIAPKSGPGRIREVAYTAPGGEEFANIGHYRYGQVAEGWSALYSNVDTSDGMAIDILSSMVDTANERYFTVDDQRDPSALATAEDIVPLADKLCTSVVAELIR